MRTAFLAYFLTVVKIFHYPASFERQQRRNSKDETANNLISGGDTERKRYCVLFARKRQKTRHFRAYPPAPQGRGHRPAGAVKSAYPESRN